MKVTYDPLADAVYIYLTTESQKVETTHMLAEGVAVDIGDKGKVVGFEILRASSCLELEQLKGLEFKEYEYDDPEDIRLIAAISEKRKREPAFSLSEIEEVR